MNSLIGMPTFICFFFTASCVFANETPSELMSTWIGIESQKGHLQNQWNERKLTIERRMLLLDDEKVSLQEILTKNQDITSDVDQRRLALTQKQDSLEKEQALIRSQLNKAIDSAGILVRKLPPPLQHDWQEKLPQLHNKNINDSEKIERILSMFKLVEDFNQRIAVHHTSMEIPNEETETETETLMVTQIYMGSSQGWYVSEDGAHYGYGHATNIGWKWWHQESASAELGHKLDPQALLKTLSIIQNPTTAEVVSLPVKL